MTKVLKLSLLGPLQLTLNNTPLTGLASAKAQALLSYLAINGRAHSRQTLAGLLWGDLPEDDARRNLRGVVMKLRHLLGNHLLITHQTVAFNPQAAYWLDIEQLHQGLQSRHLPTLRYCASLHRGEFLEELFVRQAPEFEAWLQQQRSQWQQRLISLYTTYTTCLEAEEAWEEGLQAAHQLIQLDPTREQSQQLYLRLLAHSGQRLTAVTHFEQYQQQLQQELGVSVSPETAVLVDQIRSGNYTATATPLLTAPLNQQTAPFIAGPPITHPNRFFGRDREIRRLFNLLRQRPLQNAAIIGPRRSGKTSLLHYLKNITVTPPNQLRPSQDQQWLPNPTRYQWIFVDFQDTRFSSHTYLMRYLLSGMGLPTPTPCTLDAFLETVSEQLQRPTIILFDEIGVAMTRYTELDNPFWESLRSLATNQVDGQLAYVLSSHEPPNLLAQNQEMGSPFFNIFGYTAVLGPLSEEAARQLIASSPLPFPPEDVDWILAESGRWPMPLQILCRERLLALEEGATDQLWQQDGRQQAAPFMHP